MIDLVSLDALRAVDAHGSVVAAADALGFTPSAVSQQIKRLEKQTGVPLLERVGRGVLLTRHGRHLVEQGGRLLTGLEELQSGLHQQAGTVAGHVRLTAFSTAVRGLVAPALPAVLAAHPDLRVTLTEREPWDAITAVAAGQADLGLVHAYGDIPLPVPAHLARTPLARDVAEVIIRRDHPLAARAVLTPRDLAGESWIATPEGTICRQWLNRMYDGTGRRPVIAHVSMEFETHIELARAGLGIALVPRLGRAPLGDALTAVPVADPVPGREILALHRASMSDSPALAALLGALAERGPGSLLVHGLGGGAAGRLRHRAPVQVEAPRDDRGQLQVQLPPGGCVPLHHHGRAVDAQEAGRPARLGAHVVDHQRDLVVAALDVERPAGPVGVHAADEKAGAVELEPDRHHVGLPVRGDGSEPGDRLRADVSDFLRGERHGPDPIPGARVRSSGGRRWPRSWCTTW